jgi:hypothetical protein
MANPMHDLRFVLQFGPYRNTGRCFCCGGPFTPRRGYGVVAQDLDGGGDGDVCDVCSRKHAPELLAIREVANELYHLRRALAKTSRKPAADPH